MARKSIRVTRVSYWRNTFGSFPHDRLFTLSVGIDVTSPTAAADVTLFGAGTSGGTFDYTIKRPYFARQYGAIKLWMGYPWTESFDATDVLVTRKKTSARATGHTSTQ